MLFTHLCQGRMKPWWPLRNIPGLFLRIGGLKTSQSNGVFQHTERTPPVINQPSDWGLHLFKAWVPCCSVAKLWPHGLQRTRVLCPPLSPGVCSNSWPLSQWCHPTISSSATPFSSYPQSFPASGSFTMSQLFASGGQSGISPSNEYSGLISFRIDWLDLLAVQRTHKSLLQHHS